MYLQKKNYFSNQKGGGEFVNKNIYNLNKQKKSICQQTKCFLKASFHKGTSIFH